MWNPFRKSKSKQLKELVASSVLNYIEKELDKTLVTLLKNEDVDSLKLYQLVASKCDIIITNDNKMIGFIGEGYKYDIKRGDDNYEFNIDGNIFLSPEYQFGNIPKYPSIIFRNELNTIICRGNVESGCINHNVGECPYLLVTLSVSCPDKTRTIDIKAKDGSFENTLKEDVVITTDNK